MNNQDSVQWGVMLTLPNGATDFETATSRGGASAQANSTNHHFGSEVARVVYRTVTAGPWRPVAEGPGDEWAMQVTWSAQPGRHVEVHPKESRLDAERDVRLYRDSGAPELVTRDVTCGDWWVVQAGARS